MLVISSAKIMFFSELIKSSVFFCLFLSHFMSECKKRKDDRTLILSQYEIANMYGSINKEANNMTGNEKSY